MDEDIKIIRVDEGCAPDAIRIQRTLFPESDGAFNFLESLADGSEFVFWIVRKGLDAIGTVGLYTLPCDPESAWLGWFGILPEYRRRGIGSFAVRHFESAAKERGFIYARLYTNRNDNEAAKAFYRSNGYKEEYYDCPDDPGTAVETLSVFSKPLRGDLVAPLWGNRNMHVDIQLKKQDVSRTLPSLDNARLFRDAMRQVASFLQQIR